LPVKALGKMGMGMVCYVVTIVAQQTTSVVEIARQNVQKCQLRLKLRVEI